MSLEILAKGTLARKGIVRYCAKQAWPSHKTSAKPVKVAKLALRRYFDLTQGVLWSQLECNKIEVVQKERSHLPKKNQARLSHGYRFGKLLLSRSASWRWLFRRISNFSPTRCRSVRIGQHFSGGPPYFFAHFLNILEKSDLDQFQIGLIYFSEVLKNIQLRGASMSIYIYIHVHDKFSITNEKLF